MKARDGNLDEVQYQKGHEEEQDGDRAHRQQGGDEGSKARFSLKISLVLLTAHSDQTS